MSERERTHHASSGSPQLLAPAPSLEGLCARVYTQGRRDPGRLVGRGPTRRGLRVGTHVRGARVRMSPRRAGSGGAGAALANASVRTSGMDLCARAHAQGGRGPSGGPELVLSSRDALGCRDVAPHFPCESIVRSVKKCPPPHIGVGFHENKSYYTY